MRPGKKQLAAILAIAVIAAGAYIAYTRHAGQQAAEQPAAAPPEAAGPKLLRFPPGSPQLSYIRTWQVLASREPVLEPLNARLTYDESATSRVTSPITGRVVSIEAKPGDNVKAGQPLAWLDAPDYMAARADSTKAEAEFHVKQKNMARAKMLFEGGVLARKDFEATEADLAEAEAEAQRARARLRSLTASGNVVGERYALRAAISGVVTDRQLNPGAEVRPDGPATLFTITDPKRLWLIIDLPERDLGKVKPGQTLSVEVDAFPREYFFGQVEYVGEVLDPTTRRIQVRGRVDNSSGRLRPEMFARATPLREMGAPVLQILTDAVISEGLYTYVFVELEPGVYEKRQVTLALQGRDVSYVQSGLKKGDLVVVQGALLLNSEMASGS